MGENLDETGVGRIGLDRGMGRRENERLVLRQELNVFSYLQEEKHVAKTRVRPHRLGCQHINSPLRHQSSGRLGCRMSKQYT